MRAERSVTRIDRGANQSEFVLCPRVRGFSDGCAAGRTRRSALPPSCNRPHSNGCVRLDAQRTGAGIRVEGSNRDNVRKGTVT